MKISGVLLCLTCAFLSTGFSIPGASEPDYFSGAMQLYSQGRFFEASIEFERAVFYGSRSAVTAECIYYRSLCYKRMDDYQRSLDELKRIDMKNTPDTLQLMIRYEEAFCKYMLNDIPGALGYLDEIRTYHDNEEAVVHTIPLKILCLNAERRWNDAQTLWATYINGLCLTDSLRTALTESVARIYEKKNLPKFFSQKKAFLLSVFLPGSGQVYGGSAGEGIVSLLLNAGFLGYGIAEICSGYYITGYFIGLRTSNRFYLGGVRRAYEIAGARNIEEIRRFNSSNSEILVKTVEQVRAPE